MGILNRLKRWFFMAFVCMEVGPYYMIWGKMWHPIVWLMREERKPKWKRW